MAHRTLVYIDDSWVSIQDLPKTVDLRLCSDSLEPTSTFSKPSSNNLRLPLFELDVVVQDNALLDHYASVRATWLRGIANATNQAWLSLSEFSVLVVSLT